MSFCTRLLIAFYALCAFALNSFAQTWDFKSFVNTGMEPTSIYYYGMINDTLIFDVLCNGIDVDFDGSRDSSDAAPTWNRIYLTQNEVVKSELVLEMEFGSHQWPFRPAIIVDDSGDKVPETLLFYADHGKIKALNLTQKNAVDRIFYENVYAFSVSGDGDLLYIGLRSYPNDTIVAVNWRTGDEMFRLQAYPNIQQTQLVGLSDGAIVLVALNEGSYGTPNSKITLYDFKSQPMKIDTIPLGSGGNSFTIVGDYCYAVSNGSHKIVKIDLKNRTSIGEFNTATAGYDGPRECAVSDSNKIFVSTYSDEIKCIDAESGIIDFSLDSKGKSEGIAQVGDWLLIANPFKSDGFYSPNNQVAIYHFNKANNVSENFDFEISIFPNPASEYLNFKFNDNELKIINIYNSLGVKVNTIETVESNLKINADFPTGAYYATIEMQGRIFKTNLIKF